MAGWQDIEFVCGGDETGSFGPRKEAGTALYRVETVASIGCTDEGITSLPPCSAVAGSEGVCVLLGHFVHLFDAGCLTCNASFNLDAMADAACWSADGGFVMVGDCSGSLHFIDAVNRRVLFSKNMGEVDGSAASPHFRSLFFIPSGTQGLVDLIAVCGSGSFVRVANVDLTAIRSGIDNGDMAAVKAASTAFSVSVTDTTKVHTDTLNGARVATYMNETVVISWGAGDVGVAIWSCADEGALLHRDGLKRQLNGEEVVDCCVQGDTMVTLSSKGVMSLWHLPTLIRVAVSSDLCVDNMFLVKSEASSEGAAPQLAVLTRSTDGTSRQFCVVNATAKFEVAYSLELSSTSTTISHCESDMLFVIEGRAEHGAQPNDVRFLIRCLTETLPTNRFYHLLHKHRFDEAMTFASQFGLDVELVHRVRVTSILDRADKCVEPSVQDELKASLDTINNDDDFVVDSCLQASLPNVTSTLATLEYALDRLHQKGNQDDWMIKARVLGAIKRLGTYRLLLDGSAPFDPVQWHHFREADLVREVMTAFAHGRVGTAVIIWNRHMHEYELVSHLASILSSVPEQVTTADLLPWIRCTFPYAVRQHHGFILDWVVRRIQTIEMTEREAWPQNGLDLIAAAEPVMSLYTRGATASNPKEHGTMYIPIEFADRICGYDDEDMENGSDDTAFQCAREIIGLRSKLNDIAHLQKEYEACFVLPLHQHDASAILTQLLDRIKAADLVASVIDELRPYFQRHKIAVDTFLLSYITDALDRACAQQYSIAGPLEAKVLALIDCMVETSAKLSATLELMRRVRVPWSEDVDALISTAAGWNSSRIDEFREQHRIMKLRKMMLTYRIGDFNLSDSSLARGLMRHVLADLESPTAMQDALQVVQAYHHLCENEAYVERLQNLATAKDMDRVAQLLSKVPTHMVEEVAREVLQWAATILEEPITFPEDKDQWIQAINVALTVASFCHHSLANTSVTLEYPLQSLRNMHKLQAEFQVQMSLADYMTLECRKAVFASHLSKDTGGVFDTLRNHRLSTLLQLPLTVTASVFVTQGSPKPSAQWAEQLCALCEQLLDEALPAKEVGQLQAVCLRIVEAMVQATNVSRVDPNQLARLVQHLAVRCADSALCDTVELFRCCDLVCSVFRQCDLAEIEDVGASQGAFFYKPSEETEAITEDETETDKRIARRRFFHEDGLMLDSETALSLGLNYVGVSLSEANASRSLAPYQQLRIGGGMHQSGTRAMANISKSAQEMVLYLQDKRLLQLSLRYALHSLGASVQAAMCPSGETSIQSNFYKTVLPRAATLVGSLHKGLLTKILGSPQPDRETAFGHIVSLPMEAGFGVFRTSISATKRNYDRIAQLAVVGMGFSWLWQQEPFYAECATLSENAQWWSKLNALSVPFDRKQFEQQTEAYTRKLLSVLLAKQETDDLTTALEFAQHYGITSDQVHLEYVRLSLTNNAEAQGSGQDTIQAIYPSVRKALGSVSDVDKAISVLVNDCLTTISPYNYQRLRVVLELIQRLQQRTGKQEHASFVHTGLTLLGVLSHYDRVAEPSIYEITFNEERFSSRFASTERLPFHHFIFGDHTSHWDILRPELNLQSVSKLLPIAKLLALSPDTFHVVVIEKVLHDEQQRVSSYGELQGVLEKIMDQETCIMTAKMMADCLPLGLDKIHALETAVNKTRAWRASLGESTSAELLDKVGRMEDRLSVLCRNTSTEWQLSEQGMADLLSLIREPAELISKIYEIYAVATAGQPPVEPQVLHNLTEDIAERYDLSAEKLRRFLIQKWLLSADDTDGAVPSTPSKTPRKAKPQPSLSLGSLLDEPETHSDGAVNNTVVEELPEADLNLYRAIAMLRQSPLDATVAYLLNFAYMEKSLKITPQARLRAFTALFSIASTDKICAVAGKDKPELRQHLLALMYVTRLEPIHVVLSPTEFEASDKEGLIRGLWRDHKHEQVAVRVVSDLCLDYEIHDATLWNSILLQLLKFGDHAYLAHVLVRVAGVSALWHVPSLPKVWHETLFSSSTAWIANKDSSVFSRLMELVLRSPFVLKCDMHRMMKRCLDAGEIVYGAVCAVMLPSIVEQQEHIKQLTTGEHLVELLDGLAKTDTAMAQKVKTACFDLVNGQQRYVALLNTPHFESFVEYLLGVDCVEGIFTASVRAGQLESACALVDRYVVFHPMSEASKDITLLDKQGIEACIAFAVSKGLDAVSNMLQQHLVSAEADAHSQDQNSAEAAQEPLLA